nr:hypothetical protein CFP56_65352 [Quercus suber]
MDHAADVVPRGLSILLIVTLLMVLQAAHRAKEIVISSHKVMKDEEDKHIAAMKAFELVEKKSHNLTAKLAEADHNKKSAKVALDAVERQAKA